MDGSFSMLMKRGLPFLGLSSTVYLECGARTYNRHKGGSRKPRSIREMNVEDLPTKNVPPPVARRSSERRTARLGEQQDLVLSEACWHYSHAVLRIFEVFQSHEGVPSSETASNIVVERVSVGAKIGVC